MMILFYLAYQDLSEEKVHIIIESLKDLTKNYSNIKYLIAGTGEKIMKRIKGKMLKKSTYKKKFIFLVM
ncbi:hypothetical protein CM15mP37_08990 [bacterium]|nr:MAG: hypothetical protein CM15mP37_08990 [bacterium]